MQLTKDEWIERTTKLLKSIEFNFDHPSPMRKVIGGLEIDIIRELIKEKDGLK